MWQEYFISTDKVLRKANETVENAKSAYEAMKSNQDIYKKQISKSSKKVSKKVKKHHHYVAQSVILGVIGVLIMASNVTPSQDASSYGGGFGGLVESTTIDELATAQVAKQIAQGANLLIADNIANLADSLEARVDFASTTDSYLVKPNIVSTDARTRQDIIKYTTKKADTISKLAGKFGVTSDSIRWANNLFGDSLLVGTKLKIPPVSGLIYKVKSGDTAVSLAAKYKSDADHITSFNDAELSGLRVGSQIIIPDGEKPNVIASATYVSGAYGFGNSTPIYGGNGYSYGYCTWYVANRRSAINKPIPRNLGNAVTWASIATAQGLKVVDSVPIAGAVIWHKNSYTLAGGYGHVGFVESIDSRGNAIVSDMNYTGGWNRVSFRTIPKSEFNKYLFIY